MNSNKNFKIEQLMDKYDKPFIYVDFNEIIGEDCVMLSQKDIKNDFYGNPVELCEGLEIIGYQQDEDIDGNRDDILVEGVCVLNDTQTVQHVKWLLKINDKGIRYVSDLIGGKNE